MSFATPGPSRRSGRAYGGRLRCDSTGTTRWPVHPPDRPRLSITPGGRSARSWPSPSHALHPRSGTGPPRFWGRSGRSSTGSSATTRTPRPSSGTPPPSSSADSATSTATAAATPRSDATSASTAAGTARPSSPWAISRAGGSRPTSATSTSTSPTAVGLVPFLVTAWAYSNAPFVLALPFERTEAILEGMVAAFEFFGAVPAEVWWDNPRTVATTILQGRRAARLHPRYAALASHYAFEPRFCMPGRGNEKPDAEGTVKAVQRRFATPVPRAADLAELNAWLRRRCEAERQRVVQSLFGPFAIRDRLAEDLAAAAPLPPHRFDPCVVRPAVAVDKYQTVAFDGQPLQRAPAVRLPGGHRQGVRRPGRDRGTRPGRRVARAAAPASRRWCWSRRTTSRLWPASPGRWTTRRSSATGSCRRASPRSAPSWRVTTAQRPGPAGSCGSCSCWASTRWHASAGRSRPADANDLSAPRPSSSGRGRSPRSRRRRGPARRRPARSPACRGSRSRRRTWAGSTGS